MKKINNFIQEKLKINSNSKVSDNQKNKEVLDKWKDKCKDLSCSGTFGLTSGHLKPSDFNGFVEDMRESFVPEGKSRWGDICTARYNIIQAVIDKDIDKMIQIIKDNCFDYLFACANPDSEYVYGSHLLDCWLVFELYDYLNDNKKEYTQQKFALLFRLDDTLSWVDTLKNNLKTLKKVFK